MSYVTTPGGLIQIPQQQRALPGKPTRPYKSGEVATAYDFFVLNMPINFTSTAGENQNGQTNSIGFPVQIFAGSTDISLNNRMQLRDTGQGGYTFSNDFTPFPAYVSKLGYVDQYKWWNRTHALAAQQPLSAQFINDNADPAGTAAFFSVRTPDPMTGYNPNKVRITDVSDQFQLSVSWSLTGTVNQVVPAYTPQTSFPIIIISSTFNCPVSNNLVSIKNISNNQSWSGAALKPQFFFGMENNINPTLVYPAPYYLPPMTQLEIDITNVSGINQTVFLVFNCLKCEPV